MNFATILPSVLYGSSVAGFSAAPSELFEMFRILLATTLIVGGGSLAVALVDNFAKRRLGGSLAPAAARAPGHDGPARHLPSFALQR
ncbi:MAG: hypothetical protein ABI589_04605 [Burkholderiales bacterium]